MYALTGLEGRVAVVTGAGRMRSTGRPIAVELARAGCDVVVTTSGRSAERFPPDERAVGWRGVESVAEEIRGLDRRALAVTADVTDRDAINELVETVIGQLGRVDILVNNAAAPRGADRRAVIDLPVEVWRAVYEVNLHGTFNCSQAFARAMVQQGDGGSIVNISSIGAKLMGPQIAAYGSSKLATHALAATMARELGADGIRVNVVCPGVIDTSRIDDIRENPAAWEKMMGDIPLGRPGTGEEVAALVVFLCSEQGAWITGQQWNLDGGHVTAH